MLLGAKAHHGVNTATLTGDIHLISIISYVRIYAPWLSWSQRPTVTIKQSEGREFEPHWGSNILPRSYCYLPHKSYNTRRKKRAITSQQLLQQCTFTFFSLCTYS